MCSSQLISCPSPVVPPMIRPSTPAAIWCSTKRSYARKSILPHSKYGVFIAVITRAARSASHPPCAWLSGRRAGASTAHARLGACLPGACARGHRPRLLPGSWAPARPDVLAQPLLLCIGAHPARLLPFTLGDRAWSVAQRQRHLRQPTLQAQPGRLGGIPPPGGQPCTAGALSRPEMEKGRL